MSSKQHGTDADPFRYEYRVWGRHKKARKMLSAMATSEVVQEVNDCYFLVDEAELNGKVRNNTLKVKRLVGKVRGFEKWVSAHHHHAESAPAPFDDLFVDLRLDRPRRGKAYELGRAVDRLDAEGQDRAVFVRKRRTRYRVGSIRAEVTEITIIETGRVLHTLAIEGEDLDALVALRKRLGLKGSDNVAVHTAIDQAR